MQESSSIPPLSLVSVGHFQPETRITNKFIEDLGLDTTTDWIMAKIGIESRATTLPLEYIKETFNEDPRLARAVATHTPAELGFEAAKMAIARAGIKANDIGRIICNCCTPTKVAPTEAKRIAELLDIHVPAYDVLTACPAFALHMHYLAEMKTEALPDYTLCISTATMTQDVNYKDRTDPAIWGDGAAAWIVSPHDNGPLKVLHTSFDADPTRSHAVIDDRFAFFHQDGRAVRDFSVRQTVRLLKKMEEEFSVDWSKDIFIGHQANKTMLNQITNNRGISDENHFSNVTFLGNQAGAGAPASLSERWDELMADEKRAHAKIAVAVVGAGLSWGSVLFEKV